MNRRIRRRLGVEIAMAVVSLGLFVLTLVEREWIEAVFGLDPDAGSGALELAITGVLLLTTLALVVTARFDFKRLVSTRQTSGPTPEVRQ